MLFNVIFYKVVILLLFVVLSVYKGVIKLSTYYLFVASFISTGLIRLTILLLYTFILSLAYKVFNFIDYNNVILDLLRLLSITKDAKFY